VETPDGKGTISEINLLRQKAKVRMETQGGDPVVTYFPLNELQFIKTGKQRRAELSALAQAAQESTPQASEKPTHRNLRQSVGSSRPAAPKAESEGAPAPKKATAKPREDTAPNAQTPEARPPKKFHPQRKKRPKKPDANRPKPDGPPQE